MLIELRDFHRAPTPGRCKVAIAGRRRASRDISLYWGARGTASTRSQNIEPAVPTRPSSVLVRGHPRVPQKPSGWPSSCRRCVFRLRCPNKYRRNRSSPAQYTSRASTGRSGCASPFFSGRRRPGSGAASVRRISVVAVFPTPEVEASASASYSVEAAVG